MKRILWFSRHEMAKDQRAAPTFIHAGTAAVQINVVQDLKGQEKND